MPLTAPSFGNELIEASTGALEVCLIMAPGASGPTRHVAATSISAIWGGTHSVARSSFLQMGVAVKHPALRNTGGRSAEPNAVKLSDVHCLERNQLSSPRFGPSEWVVRVDSGVAQNHHMAHKHGLSLRCRELSIRTRLLFRRQYCWAQDLDVMGNVELCTVVFPSER